MVPSLRGMFPEKTACPAAACCVLGLPLASIVAADRNAERMRAATTAVRTRECFVCTGARAP
jgi:hypothetical protein